MRPAHLNGLNTRILLCGDIYDLKSTARGRTVWKRGRGVIRLMGWAQEGDQADHAGGSRVNPRGTRESRRRAALCGATKSRDIIA